jgi:ATP-dependent Clp protease ATP-binding subunit ClpA
LPKDVVLMIVDKFLNEISQKLAPKKIDFKVSKKMRSWLADKGYDISYGARPLARLIQDKIKKPISEELLFGKLSKSGGKISIDLDDGEKLKIDISSAQAKS